MGMIQSVLRYFKSSDVWAKNVHCFTGGRIRLQVSVNGLGNALFLYCSEGENGGTSTIRLNESNVNCLIASLQEALSVLGKSSDENSLGSAS